MRTWANALALGCATMALMAAGTARAAMQNDSRSDAEEAGAVEGGAIADAPEPPEAEIVVTGSRIARSGADAPTPVTIIGAERLERLGVTNVGEALNQVPAFRPSVTPSTNGLNAASAGARLADLRGLGPLRTLVLVNGRRFTPSTAQGTTDLNMIPAVLIDRVEVVTGGASAAYGSDAVAGVVNLILNTRLQGLRGNVQYGESDAGDDRDYLVSLAAGTELFGGAAHIVVGGEYNENDGVGDCLDRAWCSVRQGTLTNPTPGVGGVPAILMLPNANASGLTAGGLITAPGPLAGIQFGPDGQPVGGYQFGQYYSPNSVFQLGGSSEGTRDAFLSGYLLKIPVRRYSLYGHIEGEIGAGIELFTDLSYGQVEAQPQSAQTRDKTLVIRQDNGFLPDSIRQVMIAQNIPSFTFGRSGLDLGRAQIDVRTRTFNGVFGARGRIGGAWQWDAYYQYGRTEYRQLTSNNRITANFNLAIDAVQAPNGSIVCRSTLTNPTNGCVPLNLFGENNFSQAAKDYAFGTARQDSTFTQHVVAGNINGSPFDTWAGPVQVAFGAEYRVNRTNSVADPISRNLGFYVANAQDIQGQAKITEGYVEAVVPLARDMAFARSLELNGALRRTHYDVSGNGTGNRFNATTWKIGAVWQPVSWLRFRATRSRDIRAANIAELFGARTQTFAVTADPVTNTSVFLPLPQPSNSQLTPEIADTATVGFAIVPDSGALSGLSFSVDYYDIQIDDAIARPGSQTIVNRCAAGATEFCAFVTRNGAGVITGIVNPLLNLNQQITRGIDFDLSYRLPLQRVSAGMGGTMNFRVLATYVADLITKDSVGSVNRAGQTGFPVGGLPGLPDWLVDATIGYDSGPLSLTVQSRYIPAGYNDVTRVGPDDPDYNPALPNSTNRNRLSSRVYFNLFGSYDFRLGGERSLQLFGGINNLFDRDPPSIHNDQIGTNGILFDTIGRTYRVGLRVRY